MVNNKIPNLFVVGAAKSGTTSFMDWLGQHPDIFMASLELNYFNSDVQGYEMPISNKKYLSYFNSANGKEKFIGEKSVMYLYSKVAAKNIKKFNSKAKIIILLRNPFELIPSWHNNSLWDGIETENDLNKALSLESFRKKKAKNKILLRTSYSDIIDFYPQIKRYYDTFRKKNVHIILLDDMKKDKKRIYRDCLKFLGVDDGFIPKFSFLNKSKSVHNKFLMSIISFFQRSPPLIRGVIKFFFPYKFRKFIRDMSSSKKKDKPVLENNKIVFSSKLKKGINHKIKGLGTLINRNLSFWYK